MDVLTHSLYQYISGSQLSLCFLEHPRRRLTVPHQRMPDQCHVILPGKLDIAVSGFEVVAMRFGVQRLPLHVVFRRDRRKLLRRDLSRSSLSTVNLRGIQRNADDKVLRKSMAEGRPGNIGAECERRNPHGQSE